MLINAGLIYLFLSKVCYLPEVSLLKLGPPEVGMLQVRQDGDLLKISSPKVGLLEDGCPDVDPNDGACDDEPRGRERQKEVDPSEIGSLELGLIEVSLPKEGPLEISFLELDFRESLTLL